jgi:hypothetical protein
MPPRACISTSFPGEKNCDRKGTQRTQREKREFFVIFAFFAATVRGCGFAALGLSVFIPWLIVFNCFPSLKFPSFLRFLLFVLISRRLLSRYQELARWYGALFLFFFCKDFC